MDRKHIGFVTGLTAELALLNGTGLRGAAGGGTPVGAAQAARRLIGQGATALVSFGLAGGLNPALPPGTLLVPAMVLLGDEIYECDASLRAWLGGAGGGAIFAGANIAVTANDKARLFANTKADAIDLESGAIAQIAAARNIPFAALRAICDPAGRDLPPAALAALSPAGRIGLLRVAGAVLRRPGQLPALLALAQDAAAARAALTSRLAVLGGG